MTNIATYLLILFLQLLLISCSNLVKNHTSAYHFDIQARASPEQEYRLQIGDQLDIKFYYNSDLNEQVTVRPDGRISLQLVHEIVAAGLTPLELTRLLTEKYAAELKEPEITLIVRSFSSQKVYVDGEVSRPGIVNLIGPLTVLQAISQAGGVKDTARTSEVVIIRRDAENKPLILPVDVKKVMDGTDMKQDIALMPYDIIFVPKSAIANVNVWVDQYIRRNIPLNFGLGYTVGP